MKTKHLMLAASAATMLSAGIALDGSGSRDDGKSDLDKLVDGFRSELNTVNEKIGERFDKMDEAFGEKTKGMLSQESFEARMTEFEEGDVKTLMERQDKIEKDLERMENGTAGARKEDKDSVFTVAARMADSDKFKQLVETERGTATMDFRAITNVAVDGTSAAGIINPQTTLPGITREPDRPLMVRDLIPVFSISTNKIDFVREDVFTNNADYQLAEGDVKPESDITWAAAEESVVTLAHWFHASMQVLMDIPMMQSEITNRGLEGYAQKEEDELMSGAGGVGQLNGLLNQATPYDAAIDALLPVASGFNQIDQLRRAIYQTRQSYYSADSIVLNPLDMAKLDLIKDGDQRYLFTSPFQGGVPRIWGKRVVESDSIAAGDYMVGAFRLAAGIYDRMVRTVKVSTEDRDNFITNMVTILIEGRVALVVRRPKAFVRGTF